MAEQTNETNIFNQSFEDLIKSVGVKASNPTESSNVATPVAEASKAKVEEKKTDAPKAKVEEKKAEAPKAKVEEKKAETAADKPATDTATAPSTDSYRVPVDVFGDQEAVDPVEKAPEEPAKPADTAKAEAHVTEPVAAKEAEKPAEKPAAKNSRNRRSAKKTAEEVKDVITVTVPLNAKVAALLDGDDIQNIQDTAEANIEASIKEAVKAAAEALINAL